MRRLEEDEERYDFRWYARVEKSHYNESSKYIDFFMFDPVDWKHYNAWYSQSNDNLKFCSDSEREEKVSLSLIRKMINFIDSSEFLNLEFIEDGEYHEYIFEI